MLLLLMMMMMMMKVHQGNVVSYNIIYFAID